MRRQISSIHHDHDFPGRLAALTLLLLSIAAPRVLALEAAASPVVTVSVGEFPGWQPGYTLFLLPGQTITLRAEIAGGAASKWSGSGRFILPSTVRTRAATAGSIAPVLPTGSTVTWRAPDKTGASHLVLRVAASDGWREALSIPVQVMAPFSMLTQGRLAGYRIGRYPPASAHVVSDDTEGADYSPPVGFLKLPETGSPIPVSPRFYLDDFACKQEARAGCDRWVALRPELICFLEAITTDVERRGFRCSVVPDDQARVELAQTSVGPQAPGRPIFVMSGYRTPAYNRSLGNVRMSRHQYGDAADIMVDSNGDEVMDDLNGDGRVTGQDAITLASWIEDLWMRDEFAAHPGGLGVYNAEGDHGPFVHVDVRGYRARWGGNGLVWKDGEEPGEAPPPPPRKAHRRAR